ncbi:ferrous iron transport protein B [Amphritea sp. 1_MG-2023]|uniref:ferrous iron transport protein B n=1 Tax=Amphritea sp. 1_MG-2023 TaxID=3062670 RepID=UPI0026E4102F|nr:ferrous iron transport protein B [Amphritea sp. 1_MG-2023]MDO6563620.1 ferrous iron transport protein B [Amphritea sp. 1_MG-2023]
MADKKTSYTIALLGNPNCGKTSLFNQLTGARQRTGNMAGVTVTSREGHKKWRGIDFHFIDLPGIYSLANSRVEERVARDYLLATPPDLILNVVDANNLARNLALTTQLLEQGLPIVIALNMLDELEKQGGSIDLHELSLGLVKPLMASDGRSNHHIAELMDLLLENLEQASEPLLIAYEPHIEWAINALTEVGLTRWQSIRWLESCGDGVMLNHDEQVKTAQEVLVTLANRHDESLAEMIAEGRYGYIHGLLHKSSSEHQDQSVADHWLDRVTLNRWLGMPIFVLLLWVMFEATFTLGSYPADWIDASVSWVGQQVGALMPASLLKNLLVEGLIAGVGGVLVFLPNVVLLFFFIALLEQSGYMARAAFLTDNLMSKVGLHGKAFVPLVMGFGCNVPAIMSARTIEEPRARLITILINPFMSCSARLPVYVLLAGIFFTDNAGTVMFSLYMLGILVAFTIAALLARTITSHHDETFIMELPPWRFPSGRSMALHVWDKAADFLKKIGGVILVGSILIWLLQSFPLHGTPWLEQLGRFVAPLFAPMGFGWQETVALLSGFIAKEVIAASLVVVYQTDMNDMAGLQAALGSALAPASGLALMVFTLLYMPCLATIATIRRETGSWRWAAVSIMMGLVLAWIGAWLVYNVASLWI